MLRHTGLAVFLALFATAATLKTGAQVEPLPESKRDKWCRALCEHDHGMDAGPDFRDCITECRTRTDLQGHDPVPALERHVRAESGNDEMKEQFEKMFDENVEGCVQDKKAVHDKDITFEDIDTNKDGVITDLEAVNFGKKLCLRESWVQQLFEAADQNRDRKLTRAEYNSVGEDTAMEKAVDEHSDPSTEGDDEYNEVKMPPFSTWDRDHDGALNEDELFNAFMFEVTHRRGVPAAEVQHHSAAYWDKVHEIMKTLDSDGNGKIEEKEYSEHLMEEEDENLATEMQEAAKADRDAKDPDDLNRVDPEPTPTDSPPPAAPKPVEPAVEEAQGESVADVAQGDSAEEAAPAAEEAQGESAAEEVKGDSVPEEAEGESAEEAEPAAKDAQGEPVAEEAQTESAADKVQVATAKTAAADKKKSSPATLDEVGFLRSLASVPMPPADDPATIIAEERDGDREDQIAVEATDSVMEEMGTPREKAEMAAAKARDAAEEKADGIVDEPQGPAPVLEGPIIPGMDVKAALQAQVETKADMQALLSFQQLSQSSALNAIHHNRREGPRSVKMLRKRSKRLQQARAGFSELNHLWRLAATPGAFSRDASSSDTVAFHRRHGQRFDEQHPKKMSAMKNHGVGKLRRLWDMVESRGSPATSATNFAHAVASATNQASNKEKSSVPAAQSKSRKSDIERLLHIANAQADTNAELAKAAAGGLRHVWQKMTKSEEDTTKKAMRIARSRAAFQDLWRVVSNPDELLKQMRVETEAVVQSHTAPQHSRIVHFLGARVRLAAP